MSPFEEVQSEGKTMWRRLCAGLVVLAVLCVAVVAEGKKHKGDKDGKDGSNGVQTKDLNGGKHGEKGGNQAGNHSGKHAGKKAGKGHGQADERTAKKHDGKGDGKGADKNSEKTADKKTGKDSGKLVGKGTNKNAARDAGKDGEKDAKKGHAGSGNLVPAFADDKGPKKSFDERTKSQQHRINVGVKKGALTPDERANMKQQHQGLADMEKGFRADGKLTKDERNRLHAAMDQASTSIWAEKHDTDGRQLAATAFGKHVYAKDSTIQRVTNPNLSGAEAKAISADYRKMLVAKKRLREDDLSPAERSKLEGHYNSLLNQYFDVRE